MVRHFLPFTPILQQSVAIAMWPGRLRNSSLLSLFSLKWGQLAAVEDELGQLFPLGLGRVSKPALREKAAG